MPAHLNRKQQREIKAVVERAKKDNGVPQTAQQSIPFQRMFPDGICRVTDSYYTKTIQFQDINYQLAQQEDKTAIFDEWCSFLNFFDSSIYQYVTEGTFDAYLYQTLENKQKFISQIMTSKSPVRSCDDVDEQALSYAEIKALCAGNPLIKEKMDLDIDVARLKVLKADHQSQQYRMEDKLLKYFPAEIERQTGYIRGFEADIQTVTAHPQIAEGFCGMEILGKHYTEKEDAGEMILAACKEMKTTEPIPLGSYRGFQMELSFDSFRHDFDITLKGAVSHRVSLGTDARGNIIRLDNALSSIPEKLEKAHEQLTNLQNQQEATRAELGKPFPQEAELAEKSARLAELDAALNMEDSMPEREEAEQADKPSVLADLKAKSEHIPPYRASGEREEVL